MNESFLGTNLQKDREHPIEGHGATGQKIVEIGAAEGLPVTAEEVREHLDSLDDSASGRWLSKARGGL